MILTSIQGQAISFTGVPEGVVIFVISSFELVEDQVACSDGRYDKEELHDSVVERDESGEQVKVASHKNQHKQDLGSS